MQYPDANMQQDPDAEMQTAVLIADDHALIAQAIAISLSSGPRQFRTQTAGTLDETLEALRSAGQFDLVLLDIKMPGMMGLASIDKVIAAAAPASVVLMSGNADRTLVKSAIEKGACGLIPKTLPLKSLPYVIDLILSGQTFIPTDGFESEFDNSNSNLAGLNGREVGIIKLLAEGQTNKEIGMVFDETEVNVKMLMRSICRKLTARNRAHVVMISKQRGLI